MGVVTIPDGGSSQNYMLLSGDLSPLYEPLLVSLSGDGGLELIEHPCAHWVVKKLIAIDSKRWGEEEGGDKNKGEYGTGRGSLQSLDWNAWWNGIGESQWKDLCSCSFREVHFSVKVTAYCLSV